MNGVAGVGPVANAAARVRMDVPAYLPPGNAERSPFVDVGALLARGLPPAPTPTICRRSDGVGLFYASQVNVLFGDPESGKTWIAYAAAAEALADGLRVVILDADHNTAQQVLSRLQGLGAAQEVLADTSRFLLAEPEDKWSLDAAVREAVEWGPHLAVVDSIGEVLPMLGLNSNNPDDYTVAHRVALRPFAVAGAAVVAIDHLPKAAESRQAGPTGTVAKGRAVGGVSLRVTVREPFSPGRGGSAKLSIRKDRPGGLRQQSPRGRGEAPAGVFVLTPSGSTGVTWRIESPRAEDALSAGEVSGRNYTPTSDDFDTVDSLRDEERRSVRALKAATGWGSDRATAVLREWKEREAAECSAFPGGQGPDHRDTADKGRSCVLGTFPERSLENASGERS